MNCLCKARRAWIARLPAVAFAVAVVLAGVPRPSFADEPSGLALSKDCTLVGASDAGTILGYDVETPDDISRAGGICSFASRSATQEGILTYAIVTQSDVAARAPFFRLLARRCAGVDPRAPSAAACASYAKLATAHDISAYFAARTGVPEAVAQPSLGDAAVSTPIAVYVRRGGEILECIVRRNEFLDVDRSLTLARLLLERIVPISAPPHPESSSSP